jgi:hypothetical protein
MVWNEIGSWIITDFKTFLPQTFSSRLAIKVSPVSDNFRPTWNYAGFFYQYVDIPVLGLSRIESKIAISIRDPIIFIPQDLHLDYQLKFQKAEWIDSLTLTIYEDSMGLNTAVDSIVFPNQNATAATAAAIAPTTTSVVLLAANPNRKGYVIENNSNQDMFFDVGATCSVAAHMLKIPKVTAGGGISSYEGDGYTGVISGIAAAAGAGAWNIREFV